MESQKKIRTTIDVIDVYGINAFQLTSLQRKLLFDDIPRVIAKRELRQRMAQLPLTSEKIRDLIFLATGDEEKAEDAMTSFIMNQMKSGKEQVV